MTKVVATLAFALLISVTSVDAQAADGQADASAGIRVAAGIGPGWARLTCAVCAPSRDLGIAGYVHVGTKVNPTLAIAAEGIGWTRTQPDGDESVRETVASIMGVAYLFAGAQKPIYLKGGLGGVGYRAGDEISLNGLGIQLGAGYVFRAGGLALTNYISIVASSFATLRNGEALVSDDVNVTLLQIGIGLARW